MSKTLSKSMTIRIPARLKQRLVKRARERGAPPSEYLRTIIEEALDHPGEVSATLFERTKDVVGSLSSKSVPSGRDARRSLAGWDPDRRG